MSHYLLLERTFQVHHYILSAKQSSVEIDIFESVIFIWIILVIFFLQNKIYFYIMITLTWNNNAKSRFIDLS